MFSVNIFCQRKSEPHSMAELHPSTVDNHPCFRSFCQPLMYFYNSQYLTAMLLRNLKQFGIFLHHSSFKNDFVNLNLVNFKLTAHCKLLKIQKTFVIENIFQENSNTGKNSFWLKYLRQWDFLYLNFRNIPN